jgi:4'-phosphopantetheinyl transferase EntD
MSPRLMPQFDSLGSSRCSVGLFDAGELRPDEYTRYLSVDEKTNYMALRSQTRKRDWLAGRLTAKYIFLNRLELSPEPQAGEWRPALTRLSAATLGDYSPWMYQNVEVVTNGGKPNLTWCGEVRPESISLSHSGSVSCASIGFGKPTAIDIEAAVPRLDAFYRINFSEVERCWANRVAGGERIRSNWFFTLLWTLKESVLKLGWLKQATVWSFPGIEIDRLPGVNDVGRFWHSSMMSSDFAVFTVRVKNQCRVMRVQVAVTGTRNHVLTVMNPVWVE